MEIQTLRDAIFNWEAWYEGQCQEEYGWEEEGEEEIQSQPDEETELEESTDTEQTDVELISTNDAKQERRGETKRAYKDTKASNLWLRI